MRSKTDALRSMQKYVSQVLAPNPPLASVYFGGTVWTSAGRVKDAIDVPPSVFRWLLRRSRFAAEVEGDLSAPLTYHRSSELVVDPAAEAAAAGVDLTGPIVAEWALGSQPQWEVRLWYDIGEIPEDRPYARVHMVGSGSTSGPALFYEVAQPMAIECYPVPGETVKESTLRAVAVEDALLEGFRGAGVQDGRPRRIPMWDFDGVSAEETSTERGTSDFMRLLDFSSRQLPDAADPRRVAVMCDARVSWRRDLDPANLESRDGTPVRGTRLVESVAVTVDAD